MCKGRSGGLCCFFLTCVCPFLLLPAPCEHGRWRILVPLLHRAHPLLPEVFAKLLPFALLVPSSFFPTTFAVLALLSFWWQNL